MMNEFPLSDRLPSFQLHSPTTKLPSSFPRALSHRHLPPSSTPPAALPSQPTSSRSSSDFSAPMAHPAYIHRAQTRQLVLTKRSQSHSDSGRWRSEAFERSRSQSHGVAGERRARQSSEKRSPAGSSWTSPPSGWR